MRRIDVPGTVASRVQPPGRGSLLWRRGGDVRLLLMAHRVLILQVAHPVVGAGVLQHSDFKADPWPRLLHTLASVSKITYGGTETAHREGQRLREYHRAIKGVDELGRRYSALDPEAYAWVLATLIEGTVTAYEIFARPFTAAERAQLYQEWRQVGRILGIAEHHLPADWPGFCVWFDEIVRTRLEDNQTVRDVLETTYQVPKPPVPLLPDAVWAPVTRPGGNLARLIAVGTLPPALRERLGLAWTVEQERRLRRCARLIRTSFAMVPPQLQNPQPMIVTTLRTGRRVRRAASRSVGSRGAKTPA